MSLKDREPDVVEVVYNVLEQFINEECVTAPHLTGFDKHLYIRFQRWFTTHVYADGTLVTEAPTIEEFRQGMLRRGYRFLMNERVRSSIAHKWQGIDVKRK